MENENILHPEEPEFLVPPLQPNEAPLDPQAFDVPVEAEVYAPGSQAFDVPVEAEVYAPISQPGEYPADPIPADGDATVYEPATQEAWADQLFGEPAPAQPQLDMDETAVFSAGLTHPADMELERILEEARSMEPEHGPDLAVHAEYPQTYADEPAPEEVPQEEPQPAKRRPAWKKGDGLFGIPHILATAVWLFIVVAVGVSLGRVAWICAADVLAFGKPPKEAIITIYENDDAEDIANKLEKAGLIEYPGLFKLYLEFSGNDAMKVGVHQLTPMIYDYHAIKTALAPKVSGREVLDVVIPEGYTCAQIFALLEEKGVCTVAELEEYAANGDLNDYWFLEGVERGSKYCLEGYLFPDTYQFYKGHNAELVLEKMLDNFDYRFTDIMKDKIDVLNQRLATTLRARGKDEAYIEAHKFTIREVVIVASMIERETANGTESYEIASVIYNRLTNPAEYPYLNIDATVIYGMGGSKVDPVTGETLGLTYADLAVDTPYNTYTRKGLIPGPIANPGRNSINAALDPNDSEYYFYVYDPSIGSHLFARDEAGHEANKAKVKNR